MTLQEECDALRNALRAIKQEVCMLTSAVELSPYWNARMNDALGASDELLRGK